MVTAKNAKIAKILVVFFASFADLPRFLRGLRFNGYELIWSRMSARQGHYVKPEMLHGHFDVLQEPEHGPILDISMP